MDLRLYRRPHSGGVLAEARGHQDQGRNLGHSLREDQDRRRTYHPHPRRPRRRGLAYVSREGPCRLSVRRRPPQKPGSTRSQQEQRASELAEWTRDQVKLDEDISPNHGWRHTFITRAEEADIKKRYVNAITGHNHGDVSDGYFSARPKALKIRIDACPRYDLDGTSDAGQS